VDWAKCGSTLTQQFVYEFVSRIMSELIWWDASSSRSCLKLRVTSYKDELLPNLFRGGIESLTVLRMPLGFIFKAWRRLIWNSVRVFATFIGILPAPNKALNPIQNYQLAVQYRDRK
jgi:hypothetical protein